MKRFVVTTYDYPYSKHLYEVDNDWNAKEYEFDYNDMKKNDLDRIAYWLEYLCCSDTQDEYLSNIRKWMEKYNADEVILISSGIFVYRIGKDYVAKYNKNADDIDWYE